MASKPLNNRKPKKSTMVQVAAMAGVTIGTVSHVINGTAPISQETTDRVNQAIKELQYTPNSIAQALRSNKSKIIGLMVPNLNNDFHATISSTFINCAYNDGYTVLMLNYEYDAKREKIDMERLADKNVDAVLLFNGCDDEELLLSMKRRKLPIILADRSIDGMNFPAIEYDNIQIMQEIILSLKNKGYERIGFISESLTLKNLQDRYYGFTCAMVQHGYQINPDHIYLSDSFRLNSLKNGYLYMKKLLEERSQYELPQVFVASSDLLAIGIMRAMKEAGYKIPQDFAIVGFDNIELSSYVYPKLSTVEQDKEQMGAMAWDLVKRIVEGDKNCSNIKLGQKLICRQSC